MAKKGKRLKISKGLQKLRTGLRTSSKSFIERITKPLTDFAQKRNTRRIEEQQSLMYLTLDDIPLNAFIRVYCDDDISALYKNGIRPEKVIEEVENEVVSKLTISFWNQMTSESERKFRYTTLKKIEIERMNIVILSSAMQLYGSADFGEITTMLKSIKVKLTGNPIEDLHLLEARLSTSLRKFESLQDELNKGESQKIDKQYFTRIVTSISVWFKFNIPFDISTSRFCEYFSQMQEGIKQQNKLNQKQKAKKGSYRK